MQNLKGKTLAILIAAILTISMGASTMLIPNAGAHTPAWNIPTYAYVNATPNPAGVGQQVLIVMWINELEPSANGITGGRWQNYEVKITAPDGTVTNLGPYTADPTSTTDTSFTPSQTGTYTVSFSFPGEVASLTNPLNGLNGTVSAYDGDYYGPSNATSTFTVQQTAAPGYTNYPLPTGYWTRPVNSQLTSWAGILSNWLYTPPVQINNIQPSGIGPQTPHIMWANVVQNGGIVGGSYNSGASKFGVISSSGYSFNEGMSYEERNIDPIIMAGNMYYTLPLSDQATGGGYICVNLQTGATVWEKSFASTSAAGATVYTYPTYGQLYGYDSINQHGVIPDGYLIATTGSTWIVYDALNGDWLFNMTNVPSSGTLRYGANGEILKYGLDPNGRFITEWNDTAGAYNGTNVNQAGEYAAVGEGASGLEWRPVGNVINMIAAYSWNMTLSTPVTPGSLILDIVPGDLMLTSTQLTQNFISSTNVFYGTNQYNMSAISLNPATLGQILWTKDYTPPPNNLTRIYFGLDASTNMFFMYDKENFDIWGYSLTTGAQIWGPVSENQGTTWQYFQPAVQNQGTASNGILVASGWGGVGYGINDTTGQLLWTYGNGPIGSDNSTNSGTLAPYGNFPLFIGALVPGSDTVYFFNSEHSPIEPPEQGEMIRAVNITTGQQIWELNGWPVSTSFYTDMGAIADGYLTFFNEYDGRMYSVGIGPSATTVQAPSNAISEGSTVTITGTVTDQSAGDKGTPAIADAYMSQWMAYLYNQFPKPTDATGVPVTLTAIDPNHNLITLGTTTSDSSGNYGFSWNTPQVPGTYQIIATFAGSNAYGGSSSTTYCTVNAPGATAAATPTPANTVNTYFVPSVIAIIILVIVGFATLFLALRKRP